MSTMFFVGIDLSDKNFHACMTDDSGNKVSASSFDFNDDGFYSFIQWLKKWLSQWLKKHKLNSDSYTDNCIIGLENPAPDWWISSTRGNTPFCLLTQMLLPGIGRADSLLEPNQIRETLASSLTTSESMRKP